MRGGQPILRPGTWQEVGTQALHEAHGALPRVGHAVVVVGKLIYAVGGRYSTSRDGKPDVHFCRDIAVFDTAAESWVRTIDMPPDMEGRAYHTASLVDGSKIWVIGGSVVHNVFGDVWIYNIEDDSWEQAVLGGDVRLLQRTAHQAARYGQRAEELLLHAGYMLAEDGGGEWMSDLVVINTRRRVVQPLRLPEASPQPGPRAYHSLTAMGRYLVLFGGRCSGDLVHGKEKLAVFDAVTNCWTMLGAAATEGTPLASRSSHRCVAVGDRLIFMGGSPADSRQETNALRTLQINGSAGVLTAKWSCEDEPETFITPPGRSAHGLAVVNDILWVVGGYGSKATDAAENGQAGRGSKYVNDVWRLQLRSSEPAAPPSPRTHPRSKLTSTNWRGTKRARNGAQPEGCSPRPDAQRQPDCAAVSRTQIQQETLQLRTALAQSHAQQKEDHAVREQLQATLTQLRAENRRTSLQVQQERSRAVSAEARSHALAEELTATCRDRDAAQAASGALQRQLQDVLRARDQLRHEREQKEADLIGIRNEYLALENSGRQRMIEWTAEKLALAEQADRLTRERDVLQADARRRLDRDRALEQGKQAAEDALEALRREHSEQHARLQRAQQGLEEEVRVLKGSLDAAENSKAAAEHQLQTVKSDVKDLESRNESLNKLRADAEIALGTCRQELSNLQLAHKHLQETAEQSAKQLQQVFGALQRGVAEGLTVLGSTCRASAG